MQSALKRRYHNAPIPTGAPHAHLLRPLRRKPPAERLANPEKPRRKRRRACRPIRRTLRRRRHRPLHRPPARPRQIQRPLPIAPCRFAAARRSRHRRRQRSHRPLAADGQTDGVLHRRAPRRTRQRQRRRQRPQHPAKTPRRRSPAAQCRLANGNPAAGAHRRAAAQTQPQIPRLRAGLLHPHALLLSGRCRLPRHRSLLRQTGKQDRRARRLPRPKRAATGL